MNRKFIYIGCTVFAMSLFHAGGIQAQEENKDSLVNVAFGTVAQEDLTHAISTVNTSELTKKVNSSSSWTGKSDRWIHRQRMGARSTCPRGWSAPQCK